MKNRNVIISYLRPDNYKKSLELCQNIIFDNGAYTFYRKKIKSDFKDFYKFLENKDCIPFFIPDVISGSEEENNYLINQCPEDFISRGIPVFHLDESNKRLEKLIEKFDYIALGSAGEYWEIGSIKWFYRMQDLMSILCTGGGIPKVKIHMLRCLNPKIFTKFPFHSGDSSNFAQNHKRDSAEFILNYIDGFNSPEKYDFNRLSYQLSIDDLLNQDAA